MAIVKSPDIADTYAGGVDDASFAGKGDGFFGRTSLTNLGLTGTEIDAVLNSTFAERPGVSISFDSYFQYLMSIDNFSAGGSEDDSGGPAEGPNLAGGGSNGSNLTVDDVSSGFNSVSTKSMDQSSVPSLEPMGMTRFDSGSIRWRESDFGASDPVFDTRFDPSNVVRRDDGTIRMSLNPTPGDSYNFSGSEISASEPTLYGRYEMNLRAAEGAGVISSMFTYTGGHEGNPHDEIDIEIFGEDPSKVQFGMFSNGEHIYDTIDLGFDTSEDFNHFVFDWTPEGITWYVNGDKVYEILGSDGYRIPDSPQRFFSNIWAVNDSASGWAGLKDKSAPAAMELASYSYTPLDELVA